MTNQVDLTWWLRLAANLEWTFSRPQRVAPGQPWQRQHAAGAGQDRRS